MKIQEAFIAAKEGKMVRHPALPGLLYGYKIMGDEGVLYEVSSIYPSILTLMFSEKFLDNWEIVNWTIPEHFKD